MAVFTIAAGTLGVWIARDVGSDGGVATLPTAHRNIFVIPPTTAEVPEGEREPVAGQDDRTWESLGFPPAELSDVELTDESLPVTGSNTAGSSLEATPVTGAMRVDDGEERGAGAADDVGGPDGGALEESPAPDGGVPPEPDTGAPVAFASDEANASEPAPAGVSCGIITCGPQEVCCNASCGICTKPGQSCHQRTCGMPYGNVSVSCGSATCNVGDVCCNPSCGICVAPGQTCDPEPCLNPIQNLGPSESCGMSTCNVGEVCCNPSCGICTKPGEPCSREVCD